MNVSALHTRRVPIGVEGARCPGTGVTDSRTLSDGCWKLNPGLLEVHQVFSITELVLQLSARIVSE